MLSRLAFIGFVASACFCLSLADAATSFGSLKAVVTWQYNEYVGTKGDVEAKLILFPQPPIRKIGVHDDITTAIGSGIDSPDMSKYGMYVGRADGYGNVEIDDIKPGRYLALIISSQTTRDVSAPIEPEELDLLQSSFASRAALMKLANPWLELHKSDVELVTIRADETVHVSHDFGNTYL